MQGLKHSACVVGLVVALFQLSQKASAKIVYTPVNVTVSANGLMKIDLNNGGTTDVTIVLSGRSILCAGTGPGSSGSVYEMPATGNGAVANGNYVLALSSGASIGPGRSYYSPQGLMWGYSTCLYPIHVDSGAWQHVTNRYLGIKFQINGHTHYGWARLNTTPGKFGPIVTLTGYAYETVVGQGLVAGVTSGP